MSKNKKKRVWLSICVQGYLENIVQNPVFKMIVLKSPPAYFKTTITSVQWQLGNYFEHCMGPPSQTSLCIVFSLPLIDILCPFHAKSICTSQDLISPTQSELNPATLISPIAITPLTCPSDHSQRSLTHNGSPRHWLLNPVPLKILTDPSKSVFYTFSLHRITNLSQSH